MITALSCSNRVTSWRVAIVALSVSIGGATALAQDGAPPPAAVRVGLVCERPLSSVVTAPGSIVSLYDGRIASETAGRLLWIAEPGDAVSKGQPIARLDTTSLELRRRENDATIARLGAGLKYQEQQVERFRELTSQHIAARNQLDEAVAQSEMTRQELEQARVARQQTEHLIARSVVAAPFGGQVVERFRQAGEYVQEGGELVRLVDTTHMVASVQAPITVAPFLTAGATVTVTDRDGRTFSAPVRAIIGVADARSRLMEVRVTLPAGAWPIGAAVQAELPSGRPENVLAVPRDALILRRDVAFVYRVNSEDAVERVPVERGSSDGEYIAVKGDLRAGDRVVVRGGETLQPGQRVAVAPDATSEAHVATQHENAARG